MIIENQYMIQLTNDGCTSHLIPFLSEWIDSSGLPYGALEWAMSNLKARDEGKICMCFLLGQPAVVEISRFDETPKVEIALGTRVRIKMGVDHYTVFTSRGIHTEEERFVRRVDKQAAPIWVQAREFKLKTIRTPYNCPTTIWGYQREVSKQLCYRWNDNKYGELLIPVDDVLGRYTVFDGPVTPEMAEAFYVRINLLDITHPLHDLEKRWLNPIEFFDILHRTAVVLGVGEDKIRIIKEEAARATAAWNPAQ